jgi:hypothetical protein
MRITMALLVGAVGILALQVLLIVGVYEINKTPEVAYCDKGKTSVIVQVNQAWRGHVTTLDKWEVGPCKLWFQASSL